MGAKKLSSRLSPQAKKLALRAGKEPVAGLAEVAPTADVDQLCKHVEKQGGKARATLANAHLLAFEIGADHLAELADLDGVVYVTTAEKYSP